VRIADVSNWLIFMSKDSQLRTLGFENCELKTKILPSKNSPEYPYKKE